MSQKPQFTVIKGEKLIKEEEYKAKLKKREDLYLKNFYLNFHYKHDYKKAAFYGVKYANTVTYNPQTTLRDMEKTLCQFEFIISALKTLTYNEFINMFPIRKDYDPTGKWEMKDYYYVKNEVLPKYNLDDVIGENILEFMSEYDNINTTGFLCKKLALFDHYLIKSQKGKPLLETFFDMIDVHPTTLVKDTKTGKFYDKETGEEIKMAKPKDSKTPQMTVITNKNLK